MKDLLGPVDGYPVTARQREVIKRTVRSLGSAIEALGDEQTELAAVDLRDSIQAIGELLGEEVEPEILNSIFEGFCIGK